MLVLSQAVVNIGSATFCGVCVCYCVINTGQLYSLHSDVTANICG